MEASSLNRILVVDDRAEIRALVQLALESIGGFTVELLCSGEEALQRASVFRPDMVLLDVTMPGLDGPATLRELRKQDTLAKTPVVFLTGKVLPQEIESYKAMGAVGVIAKPFEVSTLAGCLQEMWKMAQANVGNTGKQAAIPEALQQQLQQLKKSYIEKLPAKIKEIETIWHEWRGSNGDKNRLRDLYALIHQLSGAGATFGVPILSATGRTLEIFLQNILESGVDATPDHQDQIGKYLKVLHQIADDAVADMLAQTSKVVTGKVLALSAGGDKPLVFLVEENEYDAKQMRTQLQQANYNVRVFSRLADLQKTLAKTQPDVVIMDAIFPQANQPDAINQVQQSRDKPLPVIFISAQTDLATRLQAVRAGGYAFFPKPVDMKTLLAKLELLTGQKEAESYRVLVVDDDVDLSRYHALILQQHFIVTEILNDPLRTSEVIHCFRPDLLLLDLYMPGCNGFELASVIRQQKEWSNLPIIFLTSEKDHKKYLEAMLVGANDFLHKPVAPDQLVLTVINHLHRLRSIYKEEEAKRQEEEEKRREEEEKLHQLEQVKTQLEQQVKKLEMEMVSTRQLVSNGELAPGTKLWGSEGETYVIDKSLGSGGMGVTYLAQRTSDSSQVVLKTLLPEGIADVKVLMRFVQEARTILNFQHENLVRGYDFYQGRNLCYVVMEFVDGVSVDKIVVRHGAIEPGEATRVMLGIARGLAYLEDHHLVHRDIKPANIIIGNSGVVKLVDFGIAKMTDRDCSLTTQGIILGTPYYLSPEQTYQSDVDIRSDIYSLGATFYHLVVGQLPFDGNNVIEVLEKRFRRTPKAISANPAVPKEVSQVIEHMMQFKKERRPQHAADLVSELQDLLDTLRKGL